MLSSLLLSSLCLPTPCQAAPAGQVESTTTTAPTSEVTISREERLKRTYIYTAGSRYILQRTLEELLKDEIQRRKDAGLFVGKVEIADDLVEAEVESRMQALKEQDANLDFWDQVAAQGFTPTTFRQELRRSIQARNMYFPEDPTDWPVEMLKEVLGDTWDNFMAKTHEDFLAQKEETGEFPPLNEQTLNMMLMPTIWNYLLKHGDVQYPSDGLPEGVVLRVNERDVATEEVLATIEPFLSDTDREWAELFVDRIDMATVALQEKGAWLSKEESDALFAKEAAEYNSPPFTHELVVLQFLGYPSMEIYKQFFRVRHSFRNLLPAEGTDAFKGLQKAQLAERGEFYGGAKVQVDVILLSARDTATGKFPLHGNPYQQAKERAQEVAEILSEGTDFDQVLMEYSDYPEKVPGSQAGMPQPNHGHLPAQTRNDMRGFLGESDYTDFLFGYSISDDIFFRAELGAIYGPIRGPLGYYFYRVVQRSPATRTLDVAGVERDAYIVNDDLLTTHFLDFLSQLQND